MLNWATSAVCVPSIRIIFAATRQVSILFECDSLLICLFIIKLSFSSAVLIRFVSLDADLFVSTMFFFLSFAVYPEKRRKKDESLLSQSLASRSDTQFPSPTHAHHLLTVSGSGVSGVSFSGLSGVSSSSSPGNAMTISGAATTTSPGTSTAQNNNNNTNNASNAVAGTLTQQTSPPTAQTRLSTKAHFNSAIHTMSHEISTMASLAFHKSSKSSSSASNSMWLEEEYDQNVLQTLPERAESSSTWSSDNSSSSSSLFFNRGQRGGVVMQNTFDIVGNYFYASPEMAGGTCILNQAVDWWAVGVLLFHLLSGTFLVLFVCLFAIVLFRIIYEPKQRIFCIFELPSLLFF